MEVLVLGGGAREHALAWRLSRDDSVRRVRVAPGNGGTAAIGQNVDELAIDDPVAVTRHASRERYGLVVVGPEGPLAAGVADALDAARIPVLGPAWRAAQLEWSKAFAKRIMERAGVPTAPASVFGDPASALEHLERAAVEGRRLVVKADWLAAGKGVVVGETLDESAAAIRGLFATPEGRRPGARLLLEDRLDGREVSLLALVSGERVVPFGAARDYKRLADGDRGPNTGGMGACAPVAWFGPARIEAALAEIVEPVAWRMARDGTPYRGVLYAGLMLTDAGLRVLEFNARFGDPEAQVLLPLVEGDLAAALLGCARGDPTAMEGLALRADVAAVGVTLASAGYPDRPEVGRRLEGAEPTDRGGEGPLLCFHAGTRRTAAGYLTSGGRVATFVGVGPDPESARARAYAGLAGCRLEGGQYRSDVGASCHEVAASGAGYP